MQRATLSDVARLAGVSIKTVSRALTGEPNVAEPTRRAVYEAARRLHFRPNRLARDLRRGAVSTTVGFVVGDLENPFYSAVAAGAERVLRSKGLELVIGATDDDPERERNVIRAMIERRVQALLVAPVGEDHSYLEGEREMGTPLVFVDRPPKNLAATSVLLDNRGGAFKAVRALVAEGHQRIGFVADLDTLFTANERLVGYREALEAHDISYDATLVHFNCRHAPDAIVAFEKMMDLNNPPTAIIGLNNVISVGMMMAVKKSGISVAYVGFDDFELAEAFEVSVIGFDVAGLGGVAAEAAVARFGDATSAHETIVIETTLILRGSEKGLKL